MRILQVSSAQEIGGGELHLADLVRELARRGHEIHLITRPQSPLPQLLNEYRQVKLHELSLRNALDFKSSEALAELARQLQADVVHAHVARDYPISARATRSAEVPFILTRHHFNPLRGGLFTEWSLRNVAFLIAVSRSVAKTLTDALPRLADRVRVIPNWIGDSSLSPIEKDAAREQLGISRPLCVAIIGKISPLKGQALFVEVARLVVKNRPVDDVEFVIVGSAENHDSEYMDELRRLIATSGLSDRLRLTGFVSNIAAFMRAFDVVVAPSENEAFSLVVAEAMAAQCAVVGSNKGGIKELIEAVNEKSEAGILVHDMTPESIAREVNLILDDSDGRARMGAAARESILKRFQRKYVVDQIEALYRSLR